MSDIFPPGRWRARWIWAPGRVEGRHSVALRRVVSLDHVPSMVPARLSAVSRYTLYINGAQVSRGPVRADPRRQPYDLVDLTPHLRTGDNVIGVIEWRYDGPTAWWLTATACERPPVRRVRVRGAPRRRLVGQRRGLGRHHPRRMECDASGRHRRTRHRNH